MTGWLFGTADILRMSGDGTIIPIEGLIDNYTVYIKEAISGQGVRADATLPDGHMYSIPVAVGEDPTMYTPWINSAWLNELGLAMPQTPAQLKDVLIAFRDRKKTVLVNGIAQPIIGVSMDINNSGLGRLAGWWGLNASDQKRNQGFFAYVNGRLEFTATQPAYKEFIKYFADLNENKLLDPELFTQTQEMFDSKYSQGLLGLAAVAWGPGGPEIKTADGDMVTHTSQYEALPVLQANPSVQPVFQRNNYGGLTVFNKQQVLTNKALGKEIAIIRYLEHMVEPETRARNDWGPYPGSTLAKAYKVGDRLYQYVDTSSWTEGTPEWSWFDASGFPANMMLPGLNKAIDPPTTPAPKWNPYDLRNTMYTPYLEEKMVPVAWAIGDEAKQIADLTPVIVEYARQKQAQWISQSTIHNVDAEWNEYLAQLERYGLSTLVQLRRKIAGEPLN
jgi:putative aldouronate transport system substrate-binding protein